MYFLFYYDFTQSNLLKNHCGSLGFAHLNLYQMLAIGIVSLLRCLFSCDYALLRCRWIIKLCYSVFNLYCLIVFCIGYSNPACKAVCADYDNFYKVYGACIFIYLFNIVPPIMLVLVCCNNRFCKIKLCCWSG